MNPTEVEDDLVGHLVDLTKGGADDSLECIGRVEVMRQALDCCHKGWGESVIIGVTGTEMRFAVFVPPRADVRPVKRSTSEPTPATTTATTSSRPLSPTRSRIMRRSSGRGRTRDEEDTMQILKPTPVAAAMAAMALFGCGGGADTSNEEYAERMAVEHSDDAPVANPMSSPAEELTSIGETVVYATIDGKPVEGFLARPPEWRPGGPALIVIHEWWGLNDNIRTMARRLADEGYLSLAVDLYGGSSADSPERARELMQEVNEDAALANLGRAFSFLTEDEQAGPVGSIGWCFGGGWSLRTALLLPENLDAAVIYYGHLITDPDRLATLEMPILGHFGDADQGIPIDQVRLFEHALEEVGANATIDVYPGAGHAFANPSGRNYEAAAAETSWQRTVEFFNRTLKE